MKWSDVRQAYPDRWLIIEALVNTRRVVGKCVYLCIHRPLVLQECLVGGIILAAW